MPATTAWNPARAKVQLKLSIQRLRLLAAKKTQLAKQTRREIASLLEKGRTETAKIKVEGVMGDDTMVDLLEVLELYCELLLARFGLLEVSKDVDPGVAEAVMGLIHAAPRTELKELHILREMLCSKGGREFSIAAIDNVDNCVSSRVTSKLAVAAPPAELVDMYLYEIAKAYSVDWRPEGFSEPSAPEPLPTSAIPSPLARSAESASTVPSFTTTSTHGLSPFEIPSNGRSSDFPQTPPVEPKAAASTVIIRSSLPSPGSAPKPAPLAASAPIPAASNDKRDLTSVPAKEDDAFDALARRFAELKKR